MLIRVASLPVSEPTGSDADQADLRSHMSQCFALLCTLQRPAFVKGRLARIAAATPHSITCLIMRTSNVGCSPLGGVERLKRGLLIRLIRYSSLQRRPCGAARSRAAYAGKQSQCAGERNRVSGDDREAHTCVHGARVATQEQNRRGATGPSECQERGFFTRSAGYSIVQATKPATPAIQGVRLHPDRGQGKALPTSLTCFPRTCQASLVRREPLLRLRPLIPRFVPLS